MSARLRIAAIALGVALVIAAVVAIANDEPAVTGVEGGGGTIPFSAPLPRMIDVADTVFVGTVDRVSGPETVGGKPAVYRVTYRVERLLKGAPRAKLTVTDPLARGLGVFGADVGRRYLVLAASGPLATRSNTRLLSIGDGDGVFLTRDGRAATNDRHVTVDIAELEARLRCQRVIHGLVLPTC